MNDTNFSTLQNVKKYSYPSLISKYESFTEIEVKLNSFLGRNNNIAKNRVLESLTTEYSGINNVRFNLVRVFGFGRYFYQKFVGVFESPDS